MIRHIVFFSAKDKNDIDRIIVGLSTLKTIPHVNHLEIARNLQADTLSDDAIDIVVYGEFTDETALSAYKEHPIYQDAIKIVRPLRDMRIAVDCHAEINKAHPL